MRRRKRKTAHKIQKGAPEKNTEKLKDIKKDEQQTRYGGGKVWKGKGKGREGGNREEVPARERQGGRKR